MLLLPPEHSAPGSLEECHEVVAMAMYCQLEGLMLDAGVVITHPRVAGRKNGRSHLGIVSQQRVGVDISAPTNPSLVA
jgi:hypothetical protein